MKVSRNFELIEFVNPEIYKKFGASSIWFVDNRIINIAQWFRDYIGKPIVVNGELNGHTYVDSGLRDFTSQTGASFSQHKFGRAADLKVCGMTGEELRAICFAHEKELMSIGLTTIEESTDTWLHVDCRYTGLNKLYKVPMK